MFAHLISNNLGYMRYKLNSVPCRCGLIACVRECCPITCKEIRQRLNLSNCCIIVPDMLKECLEGYIQCK